MNFRTLLLLSVSGLIVASAAGCGDSTETTTSNGGNGGNGGAGAAGGGGNGGTGGTGGSEQTPPPKLGPQIDRMGRPAINTALNNAFSNNPEQKDAAKDDWNENSDSSKWAADYKAEIAGNLAILDSLDTVCGNQLLAGMNAVAGRYDALAGVLADDRLYINADGTACSIYLGVEANFLMVPGTATDCGGRTFLYDVIDASYTVLASGALDGSIGDTIPVSNAAGGETFPYLIAPN